MPKGATLTVGDVVVTIDPDGNVVARGAQTVTATFPIARKGSKRSVTISMGPGTFDLETVIHGLPGGPYVLAVEGGAGLEVLAHRGGIGSWKGPQHTLYPQKKNAGNA